MPRDRETNVAFLGKHSTRGSSTISPEDEGSMSCLPSAKGTVCSTQSELYGKYIFFPFSLITYYGHCLACVTFP